MVLKNKNEIFIALSVGIILLMLEKINKIILLTILIGMIYFLVKKEKSIDIDIVWVSTQRK